MLCKLAFWKGCESACLNLIAVKKGYLRKNVSIFQVFLLRGPVCLSALKSFVSCTLSYPFLFSADVLGVVF